VKWGRWWLALTYTLATLLAQGVHDHDQGTDEAVPESHVDCDEARPHATAHHVVDPSKAPASCPSCQFRAQVSFWNPASRPGPGLVVSLPIAFDRTSDLPGSPLRTRCRAPPRV